MKTTSNDVNRKKWLFQTLLLCLVTAAAVITGCSQQSNKETANVEETSKAEVQPEERPYFDAARPFV